MTMILTLANRDNVLLLSDRRLTAQGIVVDEESGKSGTLFCADGRFAFGFTGIARVVNIEIRRWLLDALYESGPPDYTIFNILNRFKDKATNYFKTNHILRRLSPSEKQLTIMFSGHSLHHDLPMIVCAFVSNYQSLSDRQLLEKSCEEFILSYENEKKPRRDSISHVQRVGAWPAMTSQDENCLREMLVAKKPVAAIIEKATSLLLQMSERPGAAGTIGKQISWIRIPTKISEVVESGYYSNIPTHTIFMPCSVQIISDRQRVCFDEPSISAVDKNTTPYMAVPKVKRNAPCPCGIGKKYRLCHGRKKR
jgi:hypothetical protein